MPAFKPFIGGHIALRQVRQIGIHLAGYYGFVVDGLRISVAVEMYGYALFPMGIHDKAVFGIFGGELLVGWSNFIAAFGGVIPAKEYPACARGIRK